MKIEGIWKTENVAKLDSIGDTTLALDPTGNPHISYYNMDIVNITGDLVYVHKVGSNWVSEIVDSAGDVGWHNSIAVDSQGNPHIAYYDNTNNKLKYAYKDSLGWHIQIVADGWQPSLILDSNGTPHISFQDNSGLQYAWWDGSSWKFKTVDGANGWKTGWWCSLALDSTGTPHISYFDVIDEYLRYAYWNGTSWDLKIADNSGTTCYYSSIAVDGNGKPHIIYFLDSGADQEIRYARWNGSSWDIETVDDDFAFPNPSLKLDSSGNPHASYVAVKELKPQNFSPCTCHARKDGSSWTVQKVDIKQTNDQLGIVLNSLEHPRILRHTMDYNGQYNLDYAYFVPSPTYTTVVFVNNYGISPVHIVYKFEITKTDETVTNKTLDQILAPGTSASFYLGKYGMKTTIRVQEYIYKKFQFAGPIHISNHFGVRTIGTYTQNINKRNVKPSPGRRTNPVFAEKEILITDTGLKVKIITPPTQK